jgi:hypothetical protein
MKSKETSSRFGMDRRTFVKQTAAVSAVGITGAVASQPGAADHRRDLYLFDDYYESRFRYKFTIDSQDYSTSKHESADDVQENDDGTTTFTGTIRQGGTDEFSFNGSVTYIKVTVKEGRPNITWDFYGDFDQNNYNRVSLKANHSTKDSTYRIRNANYGHISKYEHCEPCPSDCERRDDEVEGRVQDDIDIWEKDGVQFRMLTMQPYDTMWLKQYFHDDNVR